MTVDVEKITTRPIVSLEVERIILDKDQSGINDKIHNDEIERSTSDTVLCKWWNPWSRNWALEIWAMGKAQWTLIVDHNNFDVQRYFLVNCCFSN